MQKIARTMTATGMLVASLAFAGAPQAASAQTTRDYTTGISIQNLSTTAAATVSIQFFPENSSTASSTLTPAPIAAGTNSVFVGAQLEVTPGFRGSAIVQSDQPVAAVVNIASPDAAATFGGAAYAGFTGGSTTASLPLIFKGVQDRTGFFNTFYSVQNVGTTNATVNVTYTGLDGTTYTQNKTILPNTSATFNQELDTDITPALPAGFIGNASITSDSPVVAALMQVGVGTILGYSGFATAGSTDPVFPLVNAANSFVTGISLQNTTNATTTVTVSYTPSITGTACTETKAIGPNALGVFALNAFDGSPNGGADTCATAPFIGGAEVTANSGNAPLVGIVNQLSQSTNKGGTYASFDKSRGTSTLIFPVIQDRLTPELPYFTGLSIQNVGAAATTVTCTYTGASLTDPNTPITGSDTATLQPGDVASFVNNNNIAVGFNGSGVCTASDSGLIVGIGQQLNFAAGTGDAFFVSEGINR